DDGDRAKGGIGGNACAESDGSAGAINRAKCGGCRAISGNIDIVDGGSFVERSNGVARERRYHDGDLAFAASGAERSEKRECSRGDGDDLRINRPIRPVERDLAQSSRDRSVRRFGLRIGDVEIEEGRGCDTGAGSERGRSDNNRAAY